MPPEVYRRSQIDPKSLSLFRKLGRGLYYPLRVGRFGEVPPSDEAVMRAFLRGGPFIFTGPHRWNALNLGTTALFAVALVYNTRRSGLFEFGNRKFMLRRVRFPENPTAEWFLVDLFNNAESVGADPEELALALPGRLHIFDPQVLRDTINKFGNARTRRLLRNQGI